MPTTRTTHSGNAATFQIEKRGFVPHWSVLVHQSKAVLKWHKHNPQICQGGGGRGGWGGGDRSYFIKQQINMSHTRIEIYTRHCSFHCRAISFRDFYYFFFFAFSMFFSPYCFRIDCRSLSCWEWLVPLSLDRSRLTPQCICEHLPAQRCWWGWRNDSCSTFKNH